MLAYIVRRVFQMGLTLFAISVIAFLVMALAPGDPYASQLDPKAKPADIERKLDQMGYDDPVVNKYFKFYGGFFVDLGAVVTQKSDHDWQVTSGKTKIPVLPTMWRKMKVTLPLVLLTTLIMWTLSFPIGIFTALKRGSLIDKIVTLLAYLMISIPSFFLALHAVQFASNTLGKPMISPNSLGVELFGFSHFMDSVWHLAIPATIGAIAGVAVMTRYVKGQFLEVNGQDYIRTAKAKGLHGDQVYYKHALRNTALPFITMLSGLLPSLFGGSIITEAIFGWPGLGRWVYAATIGKDIPIVMTSLFVGSALTLFGILVSDILYSVADPRVKLA